LWRAGGALLPSCISWREYLLLLLRLLLCGWADFNLLLKCIVGELSIPTLLIIPTLFSNGCFTLVSCVLSATVGKSPLPYIIGFICYLRASALLLSKYLFCCC